MYENPSPHLESIPEHLQYRGERAKATLWHFNGEYLPEAMQTLPSLVNPNYNIGYFFWETEACPQAHELACAMLDEIWVPSDFVRKCYSVARVPVTVVGTSVELPEVAGYLPRSYFGLDDGFLFLFTFDAHSVIHRKNPAAVVRAFQKAFTEDDTRLVIKTQNFGSAHWGEINGRSEELLELCESDPRVRLMDVTLSLHELYSLKMACDSYVSLHRSEGFGYGPAEAMALGKPVIMTNYSANAEFGADGASLLVDAKLVHVLHGEYLYWSPEMMWAEPSLDHAASLMRKVYEDRTFAADLGKRGQERIVKEFGPEAMARKYAARLRELGI